MQKNEGSVTFTIRKAHLLVVLALVIAFGSGFGVGWISSQSVTVPSQASDRSALPHELFNVLQRSSFTEMDLKGRPYLGNDGAPVTIVEFTDYECPFCQQHFERTQRQLLKEYETRIKYVVLNYPLSNIHPFAQKAAEAAECAFDQGKFWEYHDKLFQNQQALNIDSLKKYARELSLNTVDFDECLGSGAKTQIVLEDIKNGQRYGVTGTPTFFVNGHRIVGAHPFSTFKTLINPMLE